MKNCLFCGDSFIGRTDKKFCSDQCRSSFHYQSLPESSALIRKINQCLKRNHHILCQYNQGKETVISRRILEREGFRFGYFTHSKKSRNGLEYFFLYDQGYASLPNGSLTLKRKTKLPDNLRVR